MANAVSFVFDDYQVEENQRIIRFNYTINLQDEEPIKLTEVLELPVEVSASIALVDKLLSALHIGLGISYYKLFLPPKFELKQKLSAQAASFWNEVYLNGLGEFLYTNKLEPGRLAKFEGNFSGSSAEKSQALRAAALLALGGGKDSIVAGELLKKAELPLSAFVLGTGEHPGQTADVARDMGLDLLDVKRRLDQKVIELNKRSDTFNGHVPISMVFALSGLLLAACSGKKYTVVGNEASASIPNTEWQGLIINHQWSKSFEFEKLLQDYVRESISTELWYFSAIRPLSSVAVAKLFSKHPRYLSDFTSCNRVFLIDPARRPNGRWCGECAKCLSSFIILAPWLDESKLIEIFSKNMLDDDAQSSVFLALTGTEGHKPLDCVGTDEEMILSLNLLAKQNKFNGSKLMQLAQSKGLIHEGAWDENLRQSLLVSSEHNFPPELKDKLISILESELA